MNFVTGNFLSDYNKDLALNMINSLSRTGTETGIILYKNIVFFTYLSTVLPSLQMNFAPDTGNFLHKNSASNTVSVTTFTSGTDDSADYFNFFLPFVMNFCTRYCKSFIRL